MTEKRQEFINTQQQNHRLQQEHHDYNYYNNNIAPGTGRVAEKEVLLPADYEAIREAYTDNIGPMTGAAAKLIEKALDGGLKVEEVIMAIEETGLAPRPSAYYLKAILENWVECGVTVSRLRHEVRVNSGQKWWR